VVVDPITLTIIIASAVFGGAGTATVVWKWEDILFALKGKRVAILGVRQIGKTTLFDYIEKGVWLENYQATLLPQEVGRRKLKKGDLEIRLRKTRDVAGSDSADLRAQWKEICEGSDIILYIVRTDLLLRGDKDIEERVESDVEHIGGWVRNSAKLFFIVGNHWNTDSEFESFIRDKEAKYLERFKALPVVSKLTQLAGGGSKIKIVLGSLSDPASADQLIVEIFTEVLRK
jgi:hypothetical protein